MFAILHIPHASTLIPDHIRRSLLLSDKELEQELLLMTDHFTCELLVCSPLPVAKIVYPVSRLVVDPERFEKDSDEPMASKGMGVIYTRTSNDRTLRNAPSAQERLHLIATYYEPHHRRLSEAVAHALDVHKHCLILDCHSFPSKPLPYEFDQSPVRPDICIGTDEVHTPAWLTESAVSYFGQAGLSAETDKPFSGTIVPKPYHRQNEAVKSLMIEVNRSLYMDEASGTPGYRFDTIRGMLQGALSFLVDSAMQHATT